jgi:hypothetical protein
MNDLLRGYLQTPQQFVALSLKHLEMPAKANPTVG